MLTDIDVRLEGERAVIAPPYATAEWGEGDNGWTIHFNPECNSTTDASAREIKSVPSPRP